MLVALTKKFNLPLAVRCTSILLYNRIKNRLALSQQQFAHLSLFIGCKFEDVHAYLERLLVGAGCEKEGIEGLVEHEIAVFEHIGFDFSYPNLYVKAQGLRLLLNEREAPIRSTWEEDCAAVDRALCSEAVFDMLDTEDPLFYNELAFAAIDVDARFATHLGLGMRADSVEKIRELIKETVLEY